MNQYGKILLKSNMKAVGASYKTEFVNKFWEACEKFKINPLTVFEEAMEAVIEKANKD